MNTHADELEFARTYTQYLHSRGLPFEGLTPEQSKLVVDRGRALYQWFKAHQRLHVAISVGVIVLLLLGDMAALLWLPSFFIDRSGPSSWGWVLLGSLVAGSVRGWIVYSIVIYSLHEGAAHRMIFPPTGRWLRHLHRLSRNLCRLAGGEPDEFAKNHLSHHAAFGTEDDGEFLNFVVPRRYWLTLIPFAMFFNFSDFVAHRSLSYTRSQLLSGAVMLAYNGVYFVLVTALYGPVTAVLVIGLVSPHVAFQLDRLRQFSEHNLMPVERQDGARSFGPGIWGLLIGGGPWGQPCHWMHHLVPIIPWYQQIALHAYATRILSPRQREQYLLAPLLGYPRLLWRLWTEPNAFIRAMTTHASSAAPRKIAST